MSDFTQMTVRGTGPDVNLRERQTDRDRDRERCERNIVWLPALHTPNKD